MSRRRSWLAASMVIATAVLVALGIAAVVATPGELTNGGDSWAGISFVLPIAVFSIVGGLIVMRRPGNPIGWLLAAIGLLFAVVLASSSVAPLGSEDRQPSAGRRRMDQCRRRSRRPGSILGSVESHFGDRCRIGIGVNSGLVLVGTVGGGDLTELGVIGDPVNVAARVQDATGESGETLLVTEANPRPARSRGPSARASRLVGTPGARRMPSRSTAFGRRNGSRTPLA